MTEAARLERDKGGVKRGMETKLRSNRWSTRGRPHSLHTELGSTVRGSDKERVLVGPTLPRARQHSDAFGPSYGDPLQQLCYMVQANETKSR